MWWRTWGAEVLLCDVDAESYVVTPDRIQALIENNKDKKITAIIIVHEFGYPVAVEAISKIARDNNIKLIEDAACALGTTADNHHVGYFSDATCLSFHPRKALTTGEGGAVISNQPRVIESIKILRNHGIHSVEGKMDFILDGLNYRMTDFQAALAIGQMERFSETLHCRETLVREYYSLLEGHKGITLPAQSKGHSWQSFMIVLDSAIDRDLMIKQLLKEGIQSNLGAQAIHCLTYFKNKYALADSKYPNATNLYKQGLVLPLHAKLVCADIEKVCTELSKCITLEVA